MFKYIIETLREILRSPSIHDSLEAHIVAGNPQTTDDVDRLEREFYQKRQVGFFETYY